MAIPVDTLMEEAKCYLCLGISIEAALQLALLNRISSGGAGGEPDLVLDNLNLDLQTPVSSVPHGLGQTPSLLRFVLVLDQAVGGWDAGYEIDQSGFWDVTSLDRPLTIGANSTLINISSNGGFVGGQWSINQFTGAGTVTITSANCHGKLYVWR